MTAPARRSEQGTYVDVGWSSLLLVAGLYFGINTELGRRYVTRQINNLEMVSGLDIDIGRLERFRGHRHRALGLAAKPPHSWMHYEVPCNENALHLHCTSIRARCACR